MLTSLAAVRNRLGSAGGLSGWSGGESAPGAAHVTGGIDRPAVLSFRGQVLTSEYIDVDLVTFLIATGPGRLESEDRESPWVVEYAQVQPLTEDGDTILLFPPVAGG